jgi:hypothetical protein
MSLITEIRNLLNIFEEEDTKIKKKFYQSNLNQGQLFKIIDN